MCNRWSDIGLQFLMTIGCVFKCCTCQGLSLFGHESLTGSLPWMCRVQSGHVLCDDDRDGDGLGMLQEQAI